MSKYRYTSAVFLIVGAEGLYLAFTSVHEVMLHDAESVEPEELKTILCCEKEDTYKQFKRFNDLVLKRIQKELNKKTECKFQYEPIKKGRSVVAIRFMLETLPKASLEEVDENQMTLEQWQEEAVKEKELWQTPLEEFKLHPGTV